MNLSVLSAFVDVVDKSTIELKMIVSKFTLAQSCANLLTIYFMLQYSSQSNYKRHVSSNHLDSCGRDFFPRKYIMYNPFISVLINFSQ